MSKWGPLPYPADPDPVGARWCWAAWTVAPWATADDRAEPLVFGGGIGGCRWVKWDPEPPMLGVDDRWGANVRYSAVTGLAAPWGPGWWDQAPLRVAVPALGEPAVPWPYHAWGPAGGTARLAMLVADGRPATFWPHERAVFAAAGWTLAVLGAHLEWLEGDGPEDAARALASTLVAGPYWESAPERAPSEEWNRAAGEALAAESLDLQDVRVALRAWAVEASTHRAGVPIPGRPFGPSGGVVWLRALGRAGDALRTLWSPGGAAWEASRAQEAWDRTETTDEEEDR